jgi:hypothetical protein
MLHLKLLRYFPLFLISYCLFLLPTTATPKVIVPACRKSSISELPQPPLSQTKPSIPSLWLTTDLFGSEFLEAWFVNPDDKWVILVVNQLTWEKQEYIDIYKFINHFGSVAREYDYNLQICQPREKKPIAAYFCDFETAPLNCHVEIQSKFGKSLFDLPKKFLFPTIE